jgi:HAD superfamily hydrolase (TIGR01548 family)
VVNAGIPTQRIELIIFDVDGVLVDVRGSFHRSTVQTVHHFTGKRVVISEIQKWKSKSGFNDDWKLSTAWIKSLGGNATYDEVKRQFMKFYWGDGVPGNVEREKWVVPMATLRRWSRRYELAIFTGRTRKELAHTLEKFRAEEIFRRVVTMDDIQNLKPHPEGLLWILDGRDPGRAVYLGDNIDDALASQRAHVPFLGVLPRNSRARRLRGESMNQLGARAILHSVTELEGWIATHRQ